MSHSIETLVFNQSNNVTPPSTTGGFSHTQTISLSYPKIFESGDQVALVNLFLYNSWQNVTTVLGNNILSYRWPTNTSSSTYTYTTYYVNTDFTRVPLSNTLQDGIYSIDDVNSALQHTMLNNGHYLVDRFGTKVYPLSLTVNPSAYCVTITSIPIPNATQVGTPSDPYYGITFGSGVSQPTGSNTGYCPQIEIASMSTLLGITAGVYPPTATSRTDLLYNAIQFYSYSFNGQTAPQVARTNSINVACSLVNASTVSPLAAQVIYTFSPSVGSGTQIQESPQNQLFLDVTRGQYTQISIRLLDDKFQPLPVIDPAISATLVIRHNRRETR